jgi:hypothetical protein
METLQRTANRGSVSTASYDIDNSVKLESDNSEFFQKSYSSASNRETWTYSTWVKRTELGSNSFLLDAYKNSNTFFILGFTDIDDLVFYDIIAGTDYGRRTTAVFRDTSAWYHIVFVSDTTNGTAGDRYRLYVNGVRVTDFDTDYGDPPSGYDGSVNDAIVHSIGYRTDATTYFNGYLAETVLVDGQALNPTDFGEFDSDSGIWIPKQITDTSYTWGTNGFWLKYDNASSMGANSAGTGGFSVQNVNQNDQATDTPTNNFCVINAINLSTQSLTQGATKIVSTDNTSRTSFGTMAVSKGKWWWEGKIQVYESNTTYPCIGVTGDLDNPPATSAQLWKGNHVIKLAKNQKWVTNDTGTSYGTTYSDNDIINIGLDMDNHIMYTYKNGTIDDASGINFSSQSAATADDFYIPINLVYVTGGGSSWEMNFGGFANYTISSAASDANGYGTFEYAPPSGYYALCTKNLAEFG